MYGWASYGGNLGGHVLSATINPNSSSKPVWRDLSLNTVTNDSAIFNDYDIDVSSIQIDPHDATGNTVYVAIAGQSSIRHQVQSVYRSIDGGGHWANITSNMLSSPANAIALDPQDANTVYVATDGGVYVTHNVASCELTVTSCWSIFGSGLPFSPVVALNVSQADASSPVLLAATYGRGIWQAPVSNVVSLTSAVPNPGSLTFTDQAMGTSSTAQTIALNNTGTVPLAVTSIERSGDFIETDDCTGASVAPAASCSIQVKFAPNAVGSRTGDLVVNANIPGGQLTLSLSGKGLPPDVVSLSPSSLDFGAVAVGSRSSVLPAQATNAGATSISITSLAVAGPFTIATNSCGTTSIPANFSCQIQLAFVPTQAGAAAGTLTMVDSAGTQTIVLSGIGRSVATDALSSTSLSFPVTAAGALADSQFVTLTNSGDLPLTAITISVTGPFQQSNTCNGLLAANSACSIRVVFAPNQTGNFTGTLTVADSVRTQTVSLAGTAVAPAALSVVPPAITFAAQQPGVPSPPQTITVSNIGAVAMANVGFEFTGPAAGNYAISSTNCGAVLAAGSSCSAQIVFTPAGTGLIAATLVVSSSTPGVSPFSISLNGGGQVGTGISANPSQINFSTVAVGQSSTARTVTISNGGGFTINSVALAASGPFTLSQNNCNGSLAAGANCTVAIAFQPTTSGGANGSLAISSPDVLTPASVSLYGTGFDFAAAVSGNGSQTVASGQTANYTIAVNPTGTSGTFTFACSGLPANSTCSFNPTSLALGSGVPGNVNVAIATGKSASASLAPLSLGHAVTLVGGLLLLPMALRRNRRTFLNIALLSLISLAIASCGGSSGGSSGSGGSGGGGSGSSTPAGTYHVAVTITSTGLSRQVNLTLTVD